MKLSVKIINLGLISYQKAWDFQKAQVQKVLEFGAKEECIILCHHNPVVTLGKKSLPSDLCGWDGETISIERGGKVTYHGPGQCIAYPILTLSERNKDIGLFLENLESALIATLESYGLSPTGNPFRGDPSLTGVWVGGKKMASIGVAIKRWVTYHGLAVNLFPDPQAFQGINPCGMGQDIMTHLTAQCSDKVDRNVFEMRFGKELISRFSL